MLREKTVEWIKQHKVIAIIKGVNSMYIEKTVKALYDGGIRIVEVTLNSSDALKSISVIHQRMNGKMVVGAGSVMTEDCVAEAANAGAKFISCIHSDAKIINQISEIDKAVIAGALTPTNIVTAKEYGADFINIFPAVTMGPSYFEQIKDPFKNQFFIAIGGINTENAAAFLKAGASGIGIGNNLVNTSLVKEGKFDLITEEARKYIDIISKI